MSSAVMHIDMDAFFASIEQRVNPGLRGKPVVIGGRNNKTRSIICAASYEAKSYGIHSGMPAWKAFQLCPQALFVPADSSKYVYTSKQLFEILKNFSPQVERFSIDEFFINVDGCQKTFHSAELMGRQIKDRIKQDFGLTCSIGVAPTLLSAKLAAKLGKPDGLMVLDKKQILEVLEDLPIEKICGIGGQLQKRFNCLGVFSCGELAQYPAEILKQHFGKIGLWLKAAAKAEDVGTIGYYAEKGAPPKSVGHSQTLRQVSTDEEFIKHWLYLLSEMVGQRLRAKQLQGKTVYVYLNAGFEPVDPLDLRSYSKQKTFSEATYDGCEIYHRVLHVLKLMNIPSLQVRVLAVSVSHLQKADTLYLFEDSQKRDRLMMSLDRINNRWGEWTVCPASLKEATY